VSSENAEGALAARVLDRSGRGSQDALRPGEVAESVDESLAARFAALFDEHAEAIFNYCYRRTANRSDADDLLSVVFLTAWKHRQRMPAGSELPWLYGVATNVIRNHWRTLRRRERLRLRLAREPSAMEVESTAADEAHVELLLRGLDELRTVERDVFTLCAWQGLSYEQAAQALGIPVGTVRSSLSRARQKLRELSDESRT
jgi:RNA polymerase sigma-70 factor, ECF subfamily